MAPKHHPTPLSGGDRKALNKELGNPSAHHEVKFDDPREVTDMICFANQLLRIVSRI